MHRDLPLRLSRSTGGEKLTSADIGDGKRVDDDVHEIVDDDDEPRGNPRRGFGVKPGRLALRPGTTARPWSILQPCNLTRKVPAIDDEMRSADHNNGQGVLRNKQKREHVESTVHKCSQRALCFLASHPLALQQVIANPVGYKLIDSEHEVLTGN